MAAVFGFQTSCAGPVCDKGNSPFFFIIIHHTP